MSDHFIDDWRTGSLTDFTVFIRDGTHGTHTRYESGIPLLSAKNITANGRVYWDCEDSFISEEDYKKIHSKYEIKPNDLLITIVGTIGRCALVNEIKERFTVQRSIAIIRPNEEFLLPTYLYQLARGNTFQKQLQLRSNSTAQAGVYLGELANFQLTIPSLEEQQKIASILSSVDEVIENTQAQIAKLEDLKKATMNELLAKGIGHTEFKDTEIGRIPKSWRCEHLSEITKRVMDYRGKSPPKSDNGLPLITAKNIRMGFISQTPREFIPHSSYDYWMVRGIPTSNDIMITTEAPLGNVALCPTYKFALGQRVIAISLNESEINPRYLVYFIQTRFFQDQIKSASTGSTVSGVKQGTLLESFVAIPPIKEQNEILIKLDGIGGTLNELNQKATKLKGLKKSLMQDLLTGKVRVQVNQDGF